MEATYRLKPKELNDDFFRLIKQTFSGKEVTITVEEIEDETEYLLKNEANREHLLKAVEDVKNGVCGHTMTFEELQKINA